jgi:putative ABC transport system permease protein
VSLLVRQLSISVAAGLLGGFVVSLLAARLLSRWLFAIHPNDPMTLMAATLLTAVAALLGSVVPAWRALRVDPLAAVRVE